MQKTILIADDEEFVRRVLHRSLSPSYKIIETIGGTEVLPLSLKEKPDLILLDITMPGKNGWDALKDLRRNIYTRMIPVIFVTGLSQLKDRLSGFTLGADDYITKPFEIDELKVRVETMLRRNARDMSANPLTHLPGSPVIEEEVNSRLRRGSPFAYLYLDIDNFKALNDAYGYTVGDRVIQNMGELLLKTCSQWGAAEFFVGHIGGDDFVVIVHPSIAEKVAKAIATDFDQQAPQYYKPEDLAKGYISALGRDGKERQFSFIRLSISIVSNEKKVITHYAEVVDIATEIKCHLKNKKDRIGSSYFLDRRLQH